MIRNHESVEVFIGLDVGKGEHHAVAVDRTGKKLFDKPLPNDERRLREILTGLETHGQILLVVDQPATIGALPVAVAQAAGVMVGYLPGLAMRRIAALHPGEAKTDARDAFIIAEAARTMPHTLRSLEMADEQLAELTMLCGFDDDLAKQATVTSNRIRGLLTQIHPALERVLGPRLDHPAVLDLLRTWPTPEALRHAGRRRIATRLKKLAPRMGERLAGEIIDALGQQSVVVVGTNAATVVLPQLAGMLTGIRQARETALDVGLPDIDGFEVLRRIRQCSNAYVVMLTGRSEEADLLNALQAGADDYITKPFRPREMRARIAAMMRRPRRSHGDGGQPLPPPEDRGSN